MNRLPVLLAAAVLTAVTGSLMLVGTAGAGSNVWTDDFPHPTRLKGYKVTCTRSGCAHRSPLLIVEKDGLRYRTVTRVIRVRGGYGLSTRVQVSVIDGQRHGLLRSMFIQGRVQSLRKGAGGWGFGSGLALSSHIPTIAPGQQRLLTTTYPGGHLKKPIRRGHRFTLTVAMSQVVHYHPRRSGSPKVAVIVLTVPFRGKPTVELKRPKP